MNDTFTSASLVFRPPCEPFKGLPELADRLGVKPNTGTGNVHLVMSDGTKYDFFDLANAFLDRIDAATRPQR